MRLGRRKDPDHRDHIFPMRDHLPSITILPNSKLWPMSSSHLNQGNTGTCVGHGWRNFLRCAPIRTTAKHPSAFDIYRTAVLLDPWKANDDEAALPDMDDGLDYGTTVRAGAKAVIQLNKLSSYAWAFDLSTTVEFLLTKGPVVIGVNWYDSMFEPGEDSYIRIKPGARNVGGHCVMLRGADIRGSRIRGTNSWGNEWNPKLKGDFYMSFNDLERLIHEDGEVCTAVQSN